MMDLNHIIVIDDEPRWTQFCQKCGLEVAKDIDGIDPDRHRVVVISSLMMDYVPELATAYNIIVATGQSTTRERIKAFRLRAVDYFTKDFRKEVLLEKLKGY